MDDDPWIDSDRPDIFTDFRVVPNSFPISEFPFDEFWQPPYEWSTADFVSTFGIDATHTPSSPQSQIIQNQFLSQASAFPRDLLFASAFAEPSMQGVCYPFPRQFCPEPGDINWNQNMVAGFPRELLNDHLFANISCFPELEVEDISIPALVRPTVSMIDHFKKSEQEPSPSLLLASNLSGDDLSSRLHNPRLECLELGSPSFDQSTQHCAHVESLEGNRCHWAVCERSFGTVMELR
jgi:hypothetical protein